MSQNISHKLKILALHGYTQSAHKFREKTFPFQGKVKKYAHFVFISAPHTTLNEIVEEKLEIEDSSENFINHSENKEILTTKSNISLDNSDSTETSLEVTAKNNSKTDQNNQNSNDTDCYAWYLRQPNENNTGYTYTGLPETLDYLDRIFKEMGPFDGVFGFSQGGCIVGLLCDLQERNLVKHVKFDFAIMASGFKYEDGDFYREKLVIPSLHIYGESDKQIPSERSKNLIECFENPVIAKHSGGHYIPGNATLKKEYETFFKEQWSRKFDKDESQS